MGNTNFEQVPLSMVMKLLEKKPNGKKEMRPATGWTGRRRITDQRTPGNLVPEAYSAAKQESPSPADDMNGGELKYPGWQGPLQDVILEFNRERLAEKAQNVEMLMGERLQQLRVRDDSIDEQEAIRYALSVLRGIKRDKLGYPDWQ